MYYYAKKYIEELQYETIDEIKAWLRTEEASKLIFSIGALIGNGAKSGFGLNQKSGKMKWQDLAMQIAGGFLQKWLPGVQAEGQPQTQESQGTEKYKSKY